MITLNYLTSTSCLLVLAWKARVWMKKDEIHSLRHEGWGNFIMLYQDFPYSRPSYWADFFAFAANILYIWRRRRSPVNRNSITTFIAKTTNSISYHANLGIPTSNANILPLPLLRALISPSAGVLARDEDTSSSHSCSQMWNHCWWILR